MNAAGSNRAGFGPNQSRPYADFVDGLSNTLFMAEVKPYISGWRNCLQQG